MGFFTLVVLLIAIYYKSQICYCHDYLWPQPQHALKFEGLNTIPESKFDISTNLQDCKILESAIKRYRDIFFYRPAKKNRDVAAREDECNNPCCPTVCQLCIYIKGCCEEWPYLGMEESYHLEVNSINNPNKIHLESATIWGALRGLETLSQMIFFTDDEKFAVHSQCITDFPRFGHRGLMIDTSRHFIPTKVILEALDAMSYNKMNVFHWHITDDQSFPYQSTSYPNLSNCGAYKCDTHIYTPMDVYTIVNYAKDRGIRVIPEFDSPSHASSWGKGNQNLLYRQKGNESACSLVDPSVASTYDFFRTFFCEAAKAFPDPFFHLGGDEVNVNCWKSSTCICEFMAERNIKTYCALEEFYFQNLQGILRENNKIAVVYQDVVDNKVALNQDTIIEIWKENYEKELEIVTKAGLRAILSSCYYLNDFESRPDWMKYYQCDPHGFKGTEAQKCLVIGGEASVWGEFVDKNNLNARTWARTLAIAERLWSDKCLKANPTTVLRMEHQRCKMIERNIRVEVINGPGYCDADYLS